MGESKDIQFSQMSQGVVYGGVYKKKKTVVGHA